MDRAGRGDCVGTGRTGERGDGGYDGVPARQRDGRGRVAGDDSVIARAMRSEDDVSTSSPIVTDGGWASAVTPASSTIGQRGAYREVRRCERRVGHLHTRDSPGRGRALSCEPRTVASWQKLG